MKTSALLSLIFVSVLMSACSSTAKRNLNDSASKMNLIDTGMTISQVDAILGTPRTGSINTDGFRCSEFSLLKHSKDFVNVVPETFYVMFYKQQVVASGQGLCMSEMMHLNFMDGQKYGRIKHQ